ncbi:MAG: YceD family protein [Acidimicrobiales bacterium]
MPVADLLRWPGTQRLVEVEADLPGLALSSAAVPPGEPVRVRLVLESTGSAVTATGELRTTYVGECRRCLREVRGDVAADVREVFERHPTEGETYPLEGDEVDLEPMVRDAVLLALPIAPLCDPACSGPEPAAYPVTVVEGAGESGLARDPRWAVLDELDLEPAEGED